MKYIFLFITLFISLASFAQVDVTCWDNDCLKNGWTWSNPASGQYTSIGCYRDGCEKSGWIAGNSSQKYYTQCKGRGCFLDGWYDIDQNTQNLRKQVVCRSIDDISKETDCMQFGWAIYSQHGQEAVISCFNKDCRNKGWLVQTSANLVRVTCKTGGCWKAGWSETW